jgi:hypothetical protein
MIDQCTSFVDLENTALVLDQGVNIMCINAIMFHFVTLFKYVPIRADQCNKYMNFLARALHPSDGTYTIVLVLCNTIVNHHQNWQSFNACTANFLFPPEPSAASRGLLSACLRVRTAPRRSARPAAQVVLVAVVAAAIVIAVVCCLLLLLFVVAVVAVAVVVCCCCCCYFCCFY